MELKEGMYVRTKYNDFCNMVAIRKMDEIDDDGSFWIDDYIVDTYGDEQNKLHEEDIEIASENIVDVIKPGDYVNGYRVSFKDNDYAPFVQCDYPVQEGTTNHYRFYEKEIYSIVTKEQFENMKYEVE